MKIRITWLCLWLILAAVASIQGCYADECTSALDAGRDLFAGYGDWFSDLFMAGGPLVVGVSLFVGALALCERPDICIPILLGIGAVAIAGALISAGLGHAYYRNPATYESMAGQTNRTLTPLDLLREAERAYRDSLSGEGAQSYDESNEFPYPTFSTGTSGGAGSVGGAATAGEATDVRRFLNGKEIDEALSKING